MSPKLKEISSEVKNLIVKIIKMSEINVNWHECLEYQDLQFRVFWRNLNSLEVLKTDLKEEGNVCLHKEMKLYFRVW